MAGSLLDRLRARAAAMRTDPIAVLPELANDAGEPLEVYASVWTVQDALELERRVGKDARWWPDMPTAAAWAIVTAKAVDAAGRPLIAAAERPEAQVHFEEAIVRQLAWAIVGGLTIEGAKKNSATSPPPEPSVSSPPDSG